MVWKVNCSQIILAIDRYLNMRVFNRARSLVTPRTAKVYLIPSLIRALLDLP